MTRRGELVGPYVEEGTKPGLYIGRGELEANSLTTGEARVGLRTCQRIGRHGAGRGQDNNPYLSKRDTLEPFLSPDKTFARYKVGAGPGKRDADYLK